MAAGVTDRLWEVADMVGKPLSPGFLSAVSAQILGCQPDQLAMLVQPPRHRLQLAADLVLSEEIE
jgi:hypothetical protein